MREELADTRELLREAIHIIHDQNRELDRIRDRYHALLNERRPPVAA